MYLLRVISSRRRTNTKPWYIIVVLAAEPTASKKGAFQCIAYMHRMNAYTAERIRTKYLLPHIEWLMQKQSEMEENAAPTL